LKTVGIFLLCCMKGSKPKDRDRDKEVQRRHKKFMSTIELLTEEELASFGLKS